MDTSVDALGRELGPDGKEWAKTDAGYAHVASMVPRAEKHYLPMLAWHGWALRGAFVAGAEWQEARNPWVRTSERRPAPNRTFVKRWDMPGFTPQVCVYDDGSDFHEWMYLP